MISFVLHTIALLAPGLWLGRRLRLPLALLFGATFLIFETSLVIGAGLLSWATLLGHLRAYQIVTTLCAISVALGLWWISRRRVAEQQPAPVPSLNLASHLGGAVTKLLYAAPVLGLVIIGGLMLRLALNAYPAIEDSLTIKLPKIIFAIQANSILPTDFTDDGRMYITPVYPALIQLFLVINGFKTHALLVFGFVNWVLCGIAVYRLCKYAGATKYSSLLVTAAMLLTPTLIALGSSEGDDLIAATPFVLGLMFLIPALYERDPVYAGLAGIGTGLSFAMKFLPLFYLPALVVVLGAIILSRGGPKWLQQKVGTVLWFSAAFVLVLMPFVISNWVAFGKPLYVSEALNSARNWPFSIECAVRASVGHVRQVMLSDIERLIAWLGANTFPEYISNVLAYNDPLSRILPFNPIPGCTAYGGPFVLTNPYLAESTVWFGLVGPVLLISSIILIVSPKFPPVARALGLGFLLWQLTFDFTTRYYGENGRYWSMAVLAGCPAIAVLLDSLLRRRWGARLAAVSIGLACVAIAAQARQVMSMNIHRPPMVSTTQYANMVSPKSANLIARANAVNIQVLYGINTYDYFMLLGSHAKLFNKVAILDGMVNIVAARPFGVVDNPFGDPRVPVQMKQPFANGFRFIGAAPGQSMSFANNMEPVIGSADLNASYLIFEIGKIKDDGQTISGIASQIGSPRIIAELRYRIGWRAADGALVMSSDWQRGTGAEFKISNRAAALVIEAMFDSDNESSLSDWPMKEFLSGIGPQMLRSFEQSATQ